MFASLNQLECFDCFIPVLCNGTEVRGINYNDKFKHVPLNFFNGALPLTCLSKGNVAVFFSMFHVLNYYI